MKRISSLLLLLMCTILPATAQKRAFTIQDNYKIQSVYNLQLTPDGTKLLYTQSIPDLKKQSYQSILHLLDTKTLQDAVLETEKPLYSPFWNADGSALYGLCVDNSTLQLYRYDLAQKSLRPVTNYPLGVESPVVSPDGKYVAFTADVYPEFGGEAPEKTIERNMRRKNGRVQAYMSDKLFYRHWTEYTEGKATHLIVYNTQTNTYKDLTPGEKTLPLNLSGEAQYAFSPDSREICFLMNVTAHPEANTNCDLFTIDVEGTNLRCITADNTAWDGTPQYSPDGKYIAYRRQAVPAYESDCFKLTVFNRQTQQSTILTEAFDNWVESFKWSTDCKNIYFTAPYHGTTPVYRITLKNQRISCLVPNHAVDDFAVAPNEKIFYTYTETGKPNALYCKEKKQESQVTHFNDALEAEVDFRPSESFWIKGAGGDSLQFFVVKPHDFDPQKKYPTVINVHGGPQMQWQNSYRGDWQVYPGAGYVIAYPNPHGSTGYGQAFCRAISGDWGGKVYEDVMLVADELEKLPYVDKDRMGAMGWSYGGWMMNWLQGHTKRFKCFVSMMGVYDMPSMWGATEELWFPEFEMQGRPWESSLYERWSPSKYIDFFSTPTLVITGERDYRVPYTQSLQYYTALQSKGIPSRLIVLKNDGHWPGNMTSMPLYYNAHLDWFHKYLGGGAAPWDMNKMINNEIEY